MNCVINISTRLVCRKEHAVILECGFLCSLKDGSVYIGNTSNKRIKELSIVFLVFNIFVRKLRWRTRQWVEIKITLFNTVTYDYILLPKYLDQNGNYVPKWICFEINKFDNHVSCPRQVARATPLNIFLKCRY